MFNQKGRILALLLAGVVSCTSGCSVVRKKPVTFKETQDVCYKGAGRPALEATVGNLDLQLSSRWVPTSDCEQKQTTKVRYYKVKSYDPTWMVTFLPIFYPVWNIASVVDTASSNDVEFVAGPLGAFAGLLIPGFFDPTPWGSYNSTVDRTETQQVVTVKRWEKTHPDTPLGGVELRLSAPEVLRTPIVVRTSQNGIATIPLESFLPPESDASLLRDVHFAVEYAGTRTENTIFVADLRRTLERRQKQEEHLVLPSLPRLPGRQ